MNRLVPTRWSHLLGYSGVGAIVRADHDLFVIEDIHQWTDRDDAPAGALVPYVDLLRATLQIDRELREPPLARLLANGALDGVCVPAMRFPGWMRCPRCGLLHWRPWRVDGNPGEGDGERVPRCHCDSKPRLQQVGWVLAHQQGGLTDVPWHALAHQGNQDCRRDQERPALYLQRDPGTGLSWKLSCKRCKSSARFDPRQRCFVGDPTRQPWERFKAGQQSESQTAAQILEVNDPRLHYPRTRSALVIPPESRVRRGSVLDRLYSNRPDCDELARRRTGLARRSAIRVLAGRYGCSKGEIEAAWDEIRKGYPLYGEAVTPGELLAKEYRALAEEIPDLTEGEDFVPRHRTRAWNTFPVSAEGLEKDVVATVDRLTALTRLREVRIFTGFSRIFQNIDDGIRPVSATESGEGESKARLVPPDLDGSLDWLPAIELYGEGIFFTLDEPMLRRWSRQPGLEARTETLQRRFQHTGMRFPDAPILPLVPRFVLLHTLAHLLIRQLETRAGYPAASIRERIYCAEGDEPMAGILVYVAVPDVAGSLGGLAELAEPKRFLQLLTSVFAHADWCSLDPVCVEHEGQGPDQLNLGACHACALVPEPSCQFANVLLDRAFVRGDIKGEIRPLLDYATRTR